MSAVKSALNQTLPSNLYKVIVVKNFYDNEIDRELSKLGVKALIERSPRQGEHVLAALKEADGDILVFLDDDDEFLPEKLQAVYDNFRDDNVILYKNRRLFINSRGEIVDVDRFHAGVKLSTVDRKFIKKIVNLEMGVNSSSIAIRRSALEHLGPESFRKLWLAIDMLYLITSLKAGGILIYDSCPLTLYRMHGNQSFINTSNFDAYASKRCSSSLRFVEDYEELMKLVKKTPYEELVKPLLIRSKLISQIFCPMVNRKGMKMLRGEATYLLLHPNIPLSNFSSLLQLYALIAGSILRIPIGPLASKVELRLQQKHKS